MYNVQYLVYYPVLGTHKNRTDVVWQDTEVRNDPMYMYTVYRKSTLKAQTCSYTAYSSTTRQITYYNLHTILDGEVHIS